MTEGNGTTDRAWPRFRLGDRVEMTLARLVIETTVIEESGPIAGKGRHLFTVRYYDDANDEHITPVPAYSLRLVDPATTAK